MAMVARAGTRARTNGQVHPSIEQDHVIVATNKVHAGVRVYDEALGGRLPGPRVVVGTHTWRDGDIEADRGVGEVVICAVRAKHLGAAVGPEEPRRLGGVVAGELETLPKAARLDPKRVECKTK